MIAFDLRRLRLLGHDGLAGGKLSGADSVVLGLLSLFQLADLCHQSVQSGLGGADVAHHVPLGELLAQVRDGLLHVRGGRLGTHPLFQQDDLGHDVLELPGEVAQGLVLADPRVLAYGVFRAVNGQEDVAVAFNTAPAGRFGQ